MPSLLNVDALKKRMREAGLNQAAVATTLNVSREAVSKWFRRESVPAPDKLVRLALLLKVRTAELLPDPDPYTPVVAFRKRANMRTTTEHVARAERMGVLLRRLAARLKLEPFSPPQFEKPTSDYAYIQQAARSIRRTLGVTDEVVLKVESLVNLFERSRTVLVPVLWGEHSAHENALHIYLPDSKTTWVFLNLDVYPHDFLFWMAHELGHVLTPQLRGNVAEDFADAFAGALLVPEAVVERFHAQLLQQASVDAQVSLIKHWSNERNVSPYCVGLQLKAFAQQHGLAELDFGKKLVFAMNEFKKTFKLVSASAFGDDPSPDDLIAAAADLKSPFFDLLRKHLVESGSEAGYIQTVMSVPATDARVIHEALLRTETATGASTSEAM